MNDRNGMKNELAWHNRDLHGTVTPAVLALCTEDLFLCAVADRFVSPALSGINRFAGVGLSSDSVCAEERHRPAPCVGTDGKWKCDTGGESRNCG